ncbi:MAG: phosphate ABC transporter permease PtsA, partial [Deltaproteobacteria bacterium]|nr:phosphate ABC transporter permease PtsA [Deltaproteobacteria bacterium]
MKPRPATGRRLTNAGVSALATLSAILGMVMLAWILGVVIIRGLGAFNLAFFTELPTPPGLEGGGLANAMIGTVVLTLLATLVAVPLGLLAGVYLAEFGQGSRLADNTRVS